MATSEDEIKALLDKLDEAIEAFITDPDSMTTYTIGDRTFNKSTTFGELRAFRGELLAQLRALSAEEVTVYDDSDFAGDLGAE